MESDSARAHAPRVPDPGARPDRLPGRVHEPDPRHRAHEPRVRRLRAGEGRHPRAPQRRADLAGGRRGGRLRAVEAAGPRPDVRLARRQALRRHGHRHPQPRQRPRRQPDQGQAADQRPRLRHRRGGAPGAADPAQRSSTRSSSSPTTSWSRSRRSRSASASASSRNTSARRRRAKRRSESGVRYRLVPADGRRELWAQAGSRAWP